MADHRKEPKFWFFDGNVILSVSDSAATRGLCETHIITLSSDRINSTTSVLFRVHKGVLARSSVVFRNMLDPDNISESSVISMNEEDLFEGLPLVRMQDSREEVQALLEALYDP